MHLTKKLPIAGKFCNLNSNLQRTYYEKDFAADIFKFLNMLICSTGLLEIT